MLSPRRLLAALALTAGLTSGAGALAASVHAAPTPPASSVIGLHKGSYGENVRALQRALIRVGVGVRYGVDGYFGSATQASVRAFQRFHGLTVTGSVDARTARGLGFWTSTATPAPKPAAKPATPTVAKTPTTTPPRAAPAPSPKAAAAVAAALSQQGVPYVAYAMTPGVGFDCSGLTAWAWAQAGVRLPHQSGLQYASLPHVTTAEARPGDLLVYHSPISHVTMYLGNGVQVQAAQTGTVVAVNSVKWANVVGVARPG